MPAGSRVDVSARTAAETPRLFLLTGPEERTREEALSGLIDEWVAPEDRELDLEFIDAGAPGFNLESVARSACERGMFSQRRMVVVRGAERLADRRYDRARAGLATTVGALPEDVRLVFVADGPETRGAVLGDPLTGVVRKTGQVRTFPLLRPEEVARRAREHAAQAGKALMPALAATLAHRSGPALSRTLQEVDKLVCYVGERPEIGGADIDLLVPATMEESIFTLLNAAAAGNRGQAIESLRRLIDDGENPSRILAMLSRTLRQLLQARFLRDRGVRPQLSRPDLPADVAGLLPEEGDVYTQAGQPWQRERLWDQAGRFTWSQLQAAVDALALSDAGTKGWDHGIPDPETALEVLVIRFSARDFA